jgi:hypothetical protein
VGGLGHYLEAEGLSTASISLIREHTVQINPPRALWVPFPLGHPFGPPHQPEFQKDVLRSLLGLFTEPVGPVLVDYPEDEPSGRTDADDVWSCPLPLPPLKAAATEAERLVQGLQSELSYLVPWYEEAVRKQGGRTLFGLSGLAVQDAQAIAAFLARFSAGEDPEPLSPEPMPAALRFMVDDLRGLYLLAASAQPGVRSNPSSAELNRWLYYETRLGDVLYRIADRFAAEAAEAAAKDPEAPRRPPPAIVPAAFRTRSTI